MNKEEQGQQQAGHGISEVRVIIADDSSIMRSLLRKFLSDNGFTVIAETGNGVDAVELVSRYKPHVLCLDIEMPGMNGLDALARIKGQQEPTQVIMITGDCQVASVQQAVRTGASGYIVKPFNGKKIIQSIHKALAEYQEPEPDAQTETLEKQ